MSVYAVIGMGSIAKRHLKNLRFLYPDADIYAVSSSGRNLDLPEGANAVVSLEELIRLKPNYVIIASPAPYHTGAARLLLENKVPVLIEKPLASDSEDATKFLELCSAESYPPVAVGYCLRFLPSALAVKAFLETGSLGTVYNVSSVVGQYLPGWRSDKNYKDSVSAKKELGGGALLELSHELDYLMWLFGSVTLQHSWLRTTAELGLEVEEIADLVLTTESGIHISVHLDFIQKSTQRKCELIGEKGRLVWDLLANTVTFIDATTTKVIYSDEQYDKNTMYLDMLRTFSVAENQGMQELATINSSLKVVQLIDAAKKTNKGRVVS
jgi:predicted dehydrogenase